MAKNLAAKLAKTTLAQRAAPYRWLHENHEQLAAGFAAHARPPWKAVAKMANEAGVACSADTLRKTWIRLQEDLTRPVAVTPPRPVPVPRKAAVPTEPPVPATVIDDQDDEPSIIEPSSKFHSRPAVARFKPKGQ